MHPQAVHPSWSLSEPPRPFIGEVVRTVLARFRDEHRFMPSPPVPWVCLPTDLRSGAAYCDYNFAIRRTATHSVS